MSFKKTLSRHFVQVVIEVAIEKEKKKGYLVTPLLYINISFLTFTVRTRFSFGSI